MGNSASKGAAQAAGKAIKRQYPTDPAVATIAGSSFYSPDEAPPTGQNVFPSRSAVTNPAIAIVNARDRIAQQFEEELEGAGRKGFAGRSLLSASEIREVIGAKEQGRWADGAIEKQFRLRSGVLAQILSAGVVKNV
ncbi:hypothetical protein DV738_g3962, partial [Chaetothyriales sp. CBS 135597]